MAACTFLIRIEKIPSLIHKKNSANHLFLAINSSEANEILPQLGFIARENYAGYAEVSKGELYPWMSIYNIDTEQASQRQKSILGVSTRMPKDVIMVQDSA